MHTSCPSTKMPSRSHSISASSMLCVVSTMARSFLLRFTTSHRLRRLAGSRPGGGAGGEKGGTRGDAQREGGEEAGLGKEAQGKG
jgi:hypothetical protein